MVLRAADEGDAAEEGCFLCSPQQRVLRVTLASGTVLGTLLPQQALVYGSSLIYARGPDIALTVCGPWLRKASGLQQP